MLSSLGIHPHLPGGGGKPGWCCMGAGPHPSQHPRGTARLRAEAGGAGGEVLPALQRSIAPSCHPGTSVQQQKNDERSYNEVCIWALGGGVILLQAPTAGLETVQEPKHGPLLFLGTLPGAPASPQPTWAGLALTRGPLAAVPGLFPKFVCKWVVSSSPKGPTLQQIFSASSAYVNTAFDVRGITHIHVCFLPWFFKRKSINNCRFISISQHPCAC